MKRFAVLLAACIVLSGCFGGGKDKDDGPTTSSSSSTSSTSAPAPGTVLASLARSTPNGAVPLTVNVTINATFQPTGAAPLLSSPSGATWALVVELLGNATDGTVAENATGEVTDELSGSTFPADESLELTEPGTYRLTVNVSAPGYRSGEDSVIVLANATGGGGDSAVLFFEGGEADESQWTISSNILLVSPVDFSETEVPEESPSGTWEINADQFHTGANSWFPGYPDNYRTRMTSVAIPLPAGSHTLTYWIRGGAEDNPVDGLHVLVGASADALEEQAFHTGAIGEWVQQSLDVSSFAGGDLVVQFRFDSDMSCSNATNQAGAICGAGFDQGGIYLDDITVV